MPGPRTDDASILALYADPSLSIKEIAQRVGVHRRHVHKVVERNDAPKRGGRPKIWKDIARLAKEGRDVNDIVALVGSSYESVSSILTRLRRDGLIGMHDGRVLSTGSAAAPPSPHLRLRLDEETRMLLDGEATDLGITPAEMANKILQAVLSDQELLEAALAA